ncbi:Bug family tripartite tricarboxylate transporter substrate binding protein [Variovorax sp. HJSM1_2]|uniref:Bug family tripartite tricarboxylate transporter substrate binding protein n=1 Tax=Variovorax sp. HJSM1_2 TaxID=3366263 RepID=UPI003BC4E6D2
MKFTICKIIYAALLIAPTLTMAADYPDKPVRLIVPYPPGGASDTVARFLGQQLSARLNQPFIIENKPGATEQIAAGYVAKSPADGYTILLASTAGLSVNPTLYKGKLPYAPEQDFAPIALVVTLPSIVMVNPSLPVKTFDELTAYIKSSPTHLTYASSGAGNPSHLGMELYKRSAGVDVTHVPYKGGAPAMQDLMSGQVAMMMAIGPESLPMAKAGKMRALAITTAKRSAAYPGLPTVSESSGYSSFELLHWFALVAPAKTPAPIVSRLNQEINEILNQKENREKLIGLGMEIDGGTPQRLADTIKKDRLKWEKVIADSNIQLD